MTAWSYIKGCPANAGLIKQWPAIAGRVAIRGYKLLLSPYLPMSCRYHPTCSDYASEAIRVHGLFRGTGLALWRILRCNPWARGGFAPVLEPAHSCRHGQGGQAAPTPHP
ncbi:MAG: membrane protein insertion efficiency factor YidD [Rhodospirillaceae bacterium]